MTWELKPAQEAFPSFAKEWDRLNQEIYGGHPMFDSRFIGPLLEYFAQGDEQLCIHRTSEKVDGALILRPRGFGRWALFLPGQAQAGTVLLRDARLMETLLDTLPGFVWLIELLALDPQYSPDWCHLHLPRVVLKQALTMAIEVNDNDFEEYWHARPRNLLKNLRRYERRTGEHYGESSFVIVDTPQEMNSAVTRYGTLEMAGWKGISGSAVDIGNVQGRFYEKIMSDFAANGQAKVLELHVDGKLASSRLIIQHKQMWIILKVAYNEALATIAPGRQLLKETIKLAFSELRHGSIEFYTDASRDQAEWATSLRYIRHQQLYRSPMFAAGHGLAQKMRALISTLTSSNDSETKPKFDPSSVKIYTCPQEFPPETVQMFDEFSRQNIESSLDWFDNLQRSVFAGDTGVRYYVAELAGQPISALSARLVQDGLIHRIETMGNFYTSLYSPVVSPAGTALDLQSILTAANKDHHGANVMHFAPMDPDLPTYEALLTALRSKGWVPFRFFCFGNWFLKVDKPWPEYLKERDGQLRSTIKRMSKKFSAKGGMLEIITDPVLAQNGIHAFNDVYSLSWKKIEPYPDFMPGLIHLLATKGQLRLGIARLDGEPIAAQLWIVSNGKASIYKLAYDESFAEYSPGTLLTAHLMEHVIDCDQVQEVDYLIGDDKYKQLWMSHRRERWGIVAYNPRTIIGVLLMARESAGRILRHFQLTRARTPVFSTSASVTQFRKNANSDQLNILKWKFIPATDFATVSAIWQSLCDATINTPLLSAEFVETALKHFGHGDEVVCIGEGPDGPVAGTILHKKNPLVWQTFQPAQMPLGPWLQQPGSAFAQVARSLLGNLPFPAMVIAATQIDPDFYVRPEGKCVMTLDSITTGRTSLAPNIEQFMDSGSVKENPKHVSGLMRRIRRAEKELGKITLESITSTEVAKDFVNKYAAMESRGWKGQNGSALLPNDVQANFYTDLMQRFALHGAARMYTLKFGDTYVARQIAVAGKRVLILLKTTYDQEFRHLGPGVIQMYRVVKDVYERDPSIKVIEMYGRFNESQKLWVSETRIIYHANVYRFGFLALLHRLWTEARKPNSSSSLPSDNYPE